MIREECIMKHLFIKKTAAAGLAAMLLLTGCASRVPSSDTPLKADPGIKTEIDLNEVSNKEYDGEKLNENYGKYTFKMLSEIAANADKNTNIMISPASIMMALDMVAAGAKGETLKQLNALFGEDTDPLEQQAFASELMKKINAANKVKFVCANAVWTDQERLGDKINTDYRDYIKKTFDAEFNATNFGPTTHEEINKWVDGKTNHMIPKLFDSPFDPNIVMVLVNAIRFEAEWQKAYEDGQIRDMDFRGTKGNKQAKMFSSTETGYFSSDKATGFIKYYEGEKYAFVAILPNDEKADANDFIKAFTYNDYIEFIHSRTADKVRTLMPEFKSDYSADMNKILKSLGVTDAFDDGKADLTGIAKPASGRLYVSQVIHKSHIEVDRKGTKAAAATGITIGVKSARPMEEEIKEVICDRPYAYAIVDVSNMNPIFIGTVNNVE